MDSETQELIDQLRDKMAGMNFNDKCTALWLLADGYFMTTENRDVRKIFLTNDR